MANDMIKRMDMERYGHIASWNIDTPRTHSNARMVPECSVISGRFVYMGQSVEYVSAEFARQLERELIAKS